MIKPRHDGMSPMAFNLERYLLYPLPGLCSPEDEGVMTTELDAPPKRTRGRPITFDRSEALQQAMKLFWERGYEGTTFDDLIAAMGISPSSFYNAFGSKERLYQEATEAYATCAAAWFTRELGAITDTKTAFHQLVTAAAREFTRDDRPTGCMIALGCTQAPPALSSLRDMMAGYRHRAQAAMADRIRRGITQGDVPKDTDVDALAAFYSALSGGMALQARDGATQQQLQEVVEFGMRAWPSAPPQPKSRRVEPPPRANRRQAAQRRPPT